MKRRWRSARDQYRWEYNPLPSTSVASRKRKYVYFWNFEFLCPVMELNQTVDNLDDSDESPTAAASAPCTSASETDQTAEASQTTQPQQPSDAGETTTEGMLGSSQITTEQPSQASSAPAPQASQASSTIPPRVRGRRSRRHEEIRMLPEAIDARVLHILNSMTPESDVDHFCHSLSPSLAKVPTQRQERVRAAMLTLLAASHGENEPNQVISPIEQWHSDQNQTQLTTTASTQQEQQVPATSYGQTSTSQQYQKMAVPYYVHEPPPASSQQIQHRSLGEVAHTFQVQQQYTRPPRQITPGLTRFRHPNPLPTTQQTSGQTYQGYISRPQSQMQPVGQVGQYSVGVNYQQQPLPQQQPFYGPSLETQSYNTTTSGYPQMYVGTSVDNPRLQTQITQSQMPPQSAITEGVGPENTTEESVSTQDDFLNVYFF
ncbi:uncharacterized protein LOC143818538 [Ranitomeya variabilis]|uniref:uncharacterized protein LOC143818538 n=1 Tax=Ranitomeya variabilis TaxID=490064 RepID=UPI004056FC6E